MQHDSERSRPARRKRGKWRNCDEMAGCVDRLEAIGLVEAARNKAACHVDRDPRPLGPPVELPPGTEWKLGEGFRMASDLVRRGGVDMEHGRSHDAPCSAQIE